MINSAAFIFLSKLLPAFIYPVGSTITLLVLAGLFLALQSRRRAMAVLLAALSWLWVCSSPIVAEWLVGKLERQFPPVALTLTPVADVAIVLGGAIGQPVAPRVEIELVNASSRILHAARLYRFGKVKRILIAGGNLPWQSSVAPESELIHQLLVEWGIPDDAIQVAGQSQNTFENALEIAELRNATAFASALLITSAAHMPRAMAVFRHAGIPVTASTVHVTAVRHPTNIFNWLPDVEALAMTTNAMKEWIGTWVYRWCGYL
jgi:uncharacterized SAM-binding protein YcdF (DUF218 family)